jgi:hypothetical protein
MKVNLRDRSNLQVKMTQDIYACQCGMWIVFRCDFFFREAYKMEYMDSTVYFVKNMLLPTMIRA